ncbi:hypothetical protein MHK_004946 [Candidatus Magnetomorum sp. HK-1]|nr:hypothetical protein MHK_004946 [Candidatus Magnetomorum sp. HK-1]
MAKKNKKNRKLRKKQQSKLLNMSDDQLIEKSCQALAKNNARDAISIIKQVLKNKPSHQKAIDLIFQAYMMREQQLVKKGMHVEAKAILDQAFEYLPDFSVISEENLCTYVAKTSLPMAADAYLSYLQKERTSKRAEKILADRVFVSGQWRLIEIFDENNLFRKDCETIKAAQLLMIDGKWEDAVQALKPLSRISPYSEFKMFCRGMAAFFVEDDREMVRSFDRISKDFTLYPMIQELKVIASPVESFKRKGHAISKTEYLWDGPVHLDRQIGQLITALEKKQSNTVKSMTQSISKALYPKQPEWASLYILLLLYSKCMIEQESPYLIESVAKDILEKKQYLLFKSKLNYQFAKWPFLSAAQYIDCLKTEFSNVESQKIAQAMILFQTAKRWFENHMSLSSKGLKFLTNQLKIDFETNEELLIALVCKGLKLDPINKKGYELLTQLPRKNRESKNVVEDQLLIMSDKFQNDPLPCLELATLYYEKHAFRKAETILEEAMKRAPHDNRVIERHVISLLISADKNYNRAKMHLVDRDIQKARQIECKTMLPFLAERSILYDVYQSPDQLLECIEKNTKSLNISERFKALSLLCLESERVITNDSRILKKILADLKKQIVTLSGIEILAILSPFPKTIAPLFPNCFIAELFNSNIKEIFKCLDDKEILSLFDIILSPYNANLIIKEIKRRLKTADPTNELLLSFYQVTLLHLENKKRDPDMFYYITEQAKGPVLDELRALSRRLSHHAAGPLKRALEAFEFSLIVVPFPHFFDDDRSSSYNDNNHDYDFDDGDDEYPINNKNLHDDNFYDDDDDDDDDDFFDDYNFFYDDDDDDDYFDGGEAFESMINQKLKQMLLESFGELGDDDDPRYELLQLEQKLNLADSMSKPDQKLISQVVKQFEHVLDLFQVRNEPIIVINMAREFFSATPHFSNILKQMADFIDKNNVRNISREAEMILFHSKKRKR